MASVIQHLFIFVEDREDPDLELELEAIFQLGARYNGWSEVRNLRIHWIQIDQVFLERFCALNPHSDEVPFKIGDWQAQVSAEVEEESYEC